ncbi:metalloproteinase inhibitor 1-like [Lissotriton helveticus]
MTFRKCIFLVAGLLILEINSPVDACSCLPSVLQNSYCYPDTNVLEVKFLGPLQKPDGTKGYNVLIDTVLKGDAALKSHTFIDSMSATSCEYHHDPNGFNVPYVVTVSIINGVLRMGDCSYRKLSSAMTPQQKEGVKGAYQKGCTCNIMPCFAKPCPSPEPKTCTLEQYEGGNGEEKTKSQVCVPKTGTECVWKPIE